MHSVGQVPNYQALKCQSIYSSLEHHNRMGRGKQPFSNKVPRATNLEGVCMSQQLFEDDD